MLHRHAARSGQLLNLNSLASDCGISQPTARQWLTVLQASHLVTLLPPYHRNFGKRLVKTPKHRYNQGLSADLTFWRDNHGLEVDLVFEHAGRLHAVEIKSGATFVPDWFDAALRWRALAGTDAAPPLLVYGGDASFEFKGLGVMGWRELGI